MAGNALGESQEHREHGAEGRGGRARQPPPEVEGEADRVRLLGHEHESAPERVEAGSWDLSMGEPEPRPEGLGNQLEAQVRGSGATRIDTRLGRVAPPALELEPRRDAGAIASIGRHGRPALGSGQPPPGAHRRPQAGTFAEPGRIRAGPGSEVGGPVPALVQPEQGRGRLGRVGQLGVLVHRHVHQLAGEGEAAAQRKPALGDRPAPRARSPAVVGDHGDEVDVREPVDRLALAERAADVDGAAGRGTTQMGGHGVGCGGVGGGPSGRSEPLCVLSGTRWSSRARRDPREPGPRTAVSCARRATGPRCRARWPTTRRE